MNVRPPRRLLICGGVVVAALLIAVAVLLLLPARGLPQVPAAIVSAYNAANGGSALLSQPGATGVLDPTIRQIAIARCNDGPGSTIMAASHGLRPSQVVGR